MGKRASATPAVSTEKCQKKNADGFQQECAPLLRFLAATDAGGGLTNVSRGMLQNMVPYALQTYKVDRHDYQDRIIGQIASLIDEEEEKHRALVKAAEDAIAEQSVVEAKVSAEVEEALKIVASQNDAKTERKSEFDTASAALQVTKDAASVVRDRHSQMLAEQKAQTDEKAEYEQALPDLFEPLKNNTYAATSWREKYKGVDKIVKMLERAGAGEALCDTTAVVLKAKAKDRGKFAEQALEYAEAALRDRIASLGDAIANFEGAKTEMDREVATAEEAVAADQALNDTAANIWIASENAWGEGKQKEFDAKNALADLKSQSEQVSKAVIQKQASLDSFLELTALFQSLRERSAVEPEAVVGIDAAPQMDVDAEVKA